jgi:hypothetical protein
MVHLTAVPAKRPISDHTGTGLIVTDTMLYFSFTNSSDISDATDGAGIIETKSSIPTTPWNRNLFFQMMTNQLSKFF